MYDLIIVGAGPAGIFTALELLRKSSNPHKILLVEKGKPVEKRLPLSFFHLRIEGRSLDSRGLTPGARRCW